MSSKNGVRSTLLVLLVALAGCNSSDNPHGVVEEYIPEKSIEFPHEVHAGKNGIDCKYCHNSATQSKSAGKPTVNVCMDCHKQVTGSKPKAK